MYNPQFYKSTAKCSSSILFENMKNDNTYGEFLFQMNVSVKLLCMNIVITTFSNIIFTILVNLTQGQDCVKNQTKTHKAKHTCCDLSFCRSITLIFSQMSAFSSTPNKFGTSPEFNILLISSTNASSLICRLTV